MADTALFGITIAADLAEQFLEVVKRRVQSQTIRDNLVILNGPDPSEVRIVALPYWSAWYHNGRGIVEPSGAHILVWYKDPSQDPRKPTNIFAPGRRLTKEEFQSASKAGLLVITKRAGPSTPHPFFDEAMVEFASQFVLATEKDVNAAVMAQLREAGVPGLGPRAHNEPAAKLRLRL
jgi:hypothetical protein